MVSAICPYCHILVVEASSAFSHEPRPSRSTPRSRTAPNVVSNSYGADEFAGETAVQLAYYDHPGVAVVASSGDVGFGVSYPASAPHVVAVGGTTLWSRTTTPARATPPKRRGRGAGSGCSTYEAKPAWQHDSGCANRSVADVAAVADPSTGVWVYSSDDGGWEVFGGTSVAAPIVGAFYALAEDRASSADVASYPYAYAGSLNDVTSGSNGTLRRSYLCDAARATTARPVSARRTPSAAFSATGTPPPPPSPVDLPPVQNPDFTISVGEAAGR